MEQSLHWGAVYEIALALKERFPNETLENVSLEQVFAWTMELPNFEDDAELANDEILMAIYQEWYEEINPL
jgi:FeS assembly protein IscX